MLEKCLEFTKPTCWINSCFAGDAFLRPKSCKTLILALYLIQYKMGSISTYILRRDLPNGAIYEIAFLLSSITMSVI